MRQQVNDINKVGQVWPCQHFSRYCQNPCRWCSRAPWLVSKQNNGVQRKESSAMQSSGLGLESSTQPPTPWSARSSGLENGNAAFSLSTMLDSLGSSMFSSSAHAYNLPYSLQSQSVSPRVDALGQGSLSTFFYLFLPSFHKKHLLKANPGHVSSWWKGRPSMRYWPKM